MSRFRPFEDLLWYDSRQESRVIYIAHRPDRKLHKWEVIEETLQGGELSILNTPSLRKAVAFAMTEAHIR